MDDFTILSGMIKQTNKVCTCYIVIIMVYRKSASALNSPDKHKTHQTRRLHFALLSDVSYDRGRKGFISSLEGLGCLRWTTFEVQKSYTFLLY
jgi:hypothetical protein